MDFKRQPPEIPKLAKLLVAIANADDLSDETRQDKGFVDYGFILIGVANGTIEGFDAWGSDFESDSEASDPEKVKDKLGQKLSKCIAPLPQLELHKFSHEERHFWVVLVPPSQAQPHFLIKDLRLLPQSPTPAIFSST